MKPKYAVVVKNNNEYNSYFGLSESEFDLLRVVFKHHKISYDYYLFIETKK